MNDSRPTVGLLVTCLVDLFRPAVAQAAVQLLEQAGFRVEVPAQTCCGQPNFNSGDEAGARAMARRMVAAFAPFEQVVAPSASCVAMVREYAALFPTGSPEQAQALALAARTVELTTFLNALPGFRVSVGEWPAQAVYHDACTGLRQLGIHAQPRALLAQVRGLQLREIASGEECCGFGGLFCVKYPEVSAHIADQKLDDVSAAGAQCLVGGDLGCLLHLQGRALRRGLPLPVAHVAEVLVGRWPGAGDDESQH